MSRQTSCYTQKFKMKDGQTDKQLNKWTERQAATYKGRQDGRRWADRQAAKKMDRQNVTHTDKMIDDQTGRKL